MLKRFLKKTLFFHPRPLIDLSAILNFLLKTADLAARLHASFTRDLPQGGRSGSFLRKTNLSTKGGSDISELLENERNCSESKTLLEIPEVAKKLPSNLWKALPGTMTPFLGRTHEKINKQRKEKKHRPPFLESHSAKAGSSTNKLFFFSEKRQKLFRHLSVLNDVSNHPLSYRIWTLTTYLTSPC